MEQLIRMDRQEMRHNLNPAHVRLTAIIHSAIVFFPVLFFGVILFLQYSGVALSSDLQSGDPGMPMTLLPVVGLVWVGTLVAAWMMPSVMLKPETLHARVKSSPPSDPVAWMTAQHRLIMIIRMAILEGGALMGLTVLILAVMSRVLVEEPLLWLGAIPLAVHVLVGVLTFPTQESVVTFMDESIVQPLRRISDS